MTNEMAAPPEILCRVTNLPTRGEVQEIEDIFPITPGPTNIPHISLEVYIISPLPLSNGFT